VTDLLATPFPDIELVLLDLLDPLLPGVSVVTALPTTLAGQIVQVERVGGSDDGITDRPRVRVRCFAGGRSPSWALARQVQALLSTKGTTTLIVGPETAGEYPRGVQLDAVSTATPPRQMPEGTATRDSRVVDTTYEVHLRRPWW
jgi:hypothetical protein